MPPDPDRPTRTRLGVLAFLCGLTFILYLDRVCIAQASVEMKRELGLSNRDWSLVLMAFTVAYGLFEVPTGRWGDRYGARRILTRVVAWWSVFTMLTAACTSFAGLLAVRFLFGAGEAGAVPNMARVVPRWFPAAERGRASGLVMAFMAVGGASAPLLSAWIIALAGWRGSFVAFGAVGLVWAWLFWVWFRDDPADHRAVNDAERRLIAAGGVPAEVGHDAAPWRAILTHPHLWRLAGTTLCAAFTSYVFLSWYPTYLREGRGLSNLAAGALGSLVLAGGAAGMVIGGVLSDRIARRPATEVPARRLSGSVAYVAAAVLLAAATFVDGALAAAGVTALAYGVAMSQQANWWACVTEIAGRHVGVVFGLLNSAAVFGALPSQYFFGWFTTLRAGQGYAGRDQWDPAFFVCSALLVVGALLWARVDPRRPVEG